MKNTQKSVMTEHIDMSLVKHTDELKFISKDGQGIPKSGTRCPEQDMGRIVPVSNGFDTTTETFNNTISIPLTIASSLVPVVYPASLTIVIRVGYQTSPRAGRLPALTKSYRTLTFLPVASWNPGKKTTVIWSSYGMTNWLTGGGVYPNT